MFSSISNAPSRASLRISKGKLVVAIDLGTTRAALAYAAIIHALERLPISGQALRGVEPEVFREWEGAPNDESDCFPITELYYEETDDQNELPLTGYLLRNNYIDSPVPFDIDRHFRLWKLLFHEPKDLLTKSIQDAMKAKLQRLNKTPFDLLRDWVAVIYEELIIRSDGKRQPTLRNGSIPDFDDLDLEIVVPVPPGRSALMHSNVRKAFVQGPIKPSQVCLVSEPEASFLWWVREETRKGTKMEVGKIYIMLDAGGGTACIVRYRLTHANPPRFVQQFASESVICGAETISEEFEKLVESRVPFGIQDRQWKIHWAVSRFNQSYKNSFGNSKSRLPFTCCLMGTNDSIQFSYEEIEACFAGPVAKLTNAIHEQFLLGSKDSRPEFLVLCGGMCRNIYVRNSLEEDFPELKICHLYHNKADVAKGAAWLRLNENFITNRPLKFTIGIVTKMEVTKKISRLQGYSEADTDINPRDRRRYVHTVQYLVKKNLSVNPSQTFRSETKVQDARKRFLNSANEIDFEDEIFILDYDPGFEGYAFIRRDGSLASRHGYPIPRPERSETIQWSPRNGGINIDKLERTQLPGLDKPTTFLRYSIHAQLTDVHVEYIVNVFYREGLKGWKSKPCGAKLVDSITDFEQISENLSRSFDSTLLDQSENMVEIENSVLGRRDREATLDVAQKRIRVRHSESAVDRDPIAGSLRGISSQDQAETDQRSRASHIATQALQIHAQQLSTKTRNENLSRIPVITDR